MSLHHNLQESMSAALSASPTIQSMALLDGSGLLISKQHREGCSPMVNEDKLSSLAALAEGITPNREPGVVCIETDQRNIFLRKEHGTTVIVAHDTE